MDQLRPTITHPTVTHPTIRPSPIWPPPTHPTIRLSNHPWIPYVVPFVGFMVFLGLESHLDIPARGHAILRAVVPALLVLLVARPALRFRLVRPGATVLVGLLVFALWMAPDLLIPGYRSHWLFNNSVVGHPESSVPLEGRGDLVVLALRALRGVLIVPIVEELFWRGWLPRWVDRMENFQAVPLGRFTPLSFWATPVLFAAEHGPFWDVGLVAGVIYNWWLARTASLGDLVLCHAVTNAGIAVWVLATGQWFYW